MSDSRLDLIGPGACNPEPKPEAKPERFFLKELEEGQWVIRDRQPPKFGIPALDEHFKDHATYVAYGINMKYGTLILGLLNGVQRSETK